MSQRPNYLDWFEFPRRPFAATPEAPGEGSQVRLFYPGAQRAKLIARAIVTLQSTAKQLLVVGPPGSGRSTTARVLAENLAQTSLLLPLPAKSISSRGSVIRRLWRAISVDAPPSSMRETVEGLIAHFSGLPEGLTPLVLVDDADLLDDASIRTLLGLAREVAHAQKSLRLAWFASPSFPERLRQLGVKRDVVSTLPLRAFRQKNSHAYLRLWLDPMGSASRIALPLTARNAIIALAGQTPGDLERLTEVALELAADRRASHVRLQDVWSARRQMRPWVPAELAPNHATQSAPGLSIGTSASIKLLLAIGLSIAGLVIWQKSMSPNLRSQPNNVSLAESISLTNPNTLSTPPEVSMGWPALQSQAPIVPDPIATALGTSDERPAEQVAAEALQQCESWLKGVNPSHFTLVLQRWRPDDYRGAVNVLTKLRQQLKANQALYGEVQLCPNGGEAVALMIGEFIEMGAVEQARDGFSANFVEARILPLSVALSMARRN